MHEQKIKYIAKMISRKAKIITESVHSGDLDRAYIMATDIHEHLDRLSEYIDEQGSEEN